jgi:TonB family protein
MTTLIAVTVKSGAILLAAVIALPFLRRQSAALRHLVLMAAIVAATALPLVGLVFPAWHLPAPVVSSLPRFDAPAAAPIARAPDAASAVHVITPAPRVRWLQWLVALWLTGAVVAAGSLVSGLWRVAWLKRRATPIASGPWAERAKVIAHDYGISRPIALLETSHPSLLAAFGILRPTVLVPRAARPWSDERIAIVLAHELAHVKRGDWIVHLLAEILRAWHWFNPMAWLACTRLRHESEQACDDIVVSRGISGAAYAEQLLAVARELRVGHQWMPALSIVQPSGFERRITRMLTSTVNRRPVTRTRALAVVMATAAITLPIAGLAAQAAMSKLAGTVADPQNGVLPGTTIVLTHATTNVRREIRSDPNGRFEFAGLEPGDYALDAVVAGFERFQGTLTIGTGDVQQNLRLDVGTVQETVTVRESRSGRVVAEVVPTDPAAQQRADEYRRMRAAQVCTSAPARPTPFLGGNLRAPRRFKDVKPVYPEAMRAAGVSGDVLITARIAKDGLVEDIAVVSSPNPVLSEAAIQAISGWEFDATLLNCMPVDAKIEIRTRFELTP